MKGINDFIVHIPKRYNETYKTEGGLELHADERWSPRELANTVVKVVSVPFKHNGPIKEGMEVFLDTTALLDHVFSKVTQRAKYCVDQEKSLYKIYPSLIIMYKENGKWIGNEDNVIAEKITTSKPKVKSSLIYIPESAIETIEKGKAKIVYGNVHLKEFENVENGETVFINDDLEIDVILQNKKYIWLKNRDIIGKQLNKTA